MGGIVMTEERDDFSYLNSTEDEHYKRFGISLEKIDSGLSFGVCISYDKYAKECYLFINLFKWGISIGWLTFERKREEE